MAMVKVDLIENEVMEVKTSGTIIRIGSMDYELGESLVVEDGVLSVKTTDDIEEGNMLPVSSNAVYKSLGNIENKLESI